MPKARPKVPRPTRTFFREWRKFRGYTQEQAAEMIGIDQSGLSRLERGSPYNQAFLEAAAAAYRCEPADLLIRNPLIPDAVWSITDNLRKADPDELPRIKSVIDALTKKAS
jgi:transcriptional regulator with XRE-family HTH domain